MTEETLTKRPIRSFVRREGRMTPGQKCALSELWDLYGLALPQKGERLSIEPNTILEIGFGMGDSLLEMASHYPENQYIGVEVHQPGVGRFLGNLKDNEIHNVSVHKEDAVALLKEYIPDNSLSGVQIFFPDPWPKKRHHKRRLIQKDFVTLLISKLKIDGTLHLATDWHDYAIQMQETCDDFKQLAKANPLWRPKTKFEKRGERLGHGIWDFVYKKLY